MAEQGGSSSDVNRTTVFIGCVIALVATSFGFAIRGQLLGEWQNLFNLSGEQVGYIQGAGLFPFALTIILFSLVVDQLGYGVSMAIAFLLHVASAIITVCAPLAGTEHGSFLMLYVGTFIFALGNGTVEAVINPVTATLFPDEKTHYLSILHAGWPLGLMLGSLVGAGVIQYGDALGGALPGKLWVWRMGLMVLPMLVYGAILVGQIFPVQERVEAGVSYYEMLQEFGWGSAFIVFVLVIAGVNQILTIAEVPKAGPGTWVLIAVVLTIPFAVYVKKFGRPLFVILLLIMCLLATTELGGDSWMQEVIGAFTSPTTGALFFAWMAFLMFVLRFFAGPIVETLNPLGVLTASSIVAAAGLFGLSAVTGLGLVFVAATVYGIGKSYFWPVTLGIVGEQFPRGGALTINAIAGVGMVFVGTLGNPSIGTVQDLEIVNRVQEQKPEVAEQIIEKEQGMWGEYRTVNQDKIDTLPEDQKKAVREILENGKQASFGWLAILPLVMFICYLGLLGYFRSIGGYKPEALQSKSDVDADLEGDTGETASERGESDDEGGSTVGEDREA